MAGFSAAGERILAAQLEPGVNPITFSDDGERLASWAGGDPETVVWSTDGRRLARCRDVFDRDPGRPGQRVGCPFRCPVVPLRQLGCSRAARIGPRKIATAQMSLAYARLTLPVIMR